LSSLESAVSILRCFSHETPELAVSDVAARLGMPKSSVSRLLRTMGEQGLVEQDPDTRRYRLGIFVVELGQLYHSDLKVIDLVDAEVEALVKDTGFTAYIGVLIEGDIVILRRRHGAYPVRMMLEPGFRMPAVPAAFGMALLARLPDEKLRTMLTAEARGKRQRSEVFAELDEIRERHWAIADEAFPGMCAIGTAVGSADDQPAVGFSLSFPDHAVDAKMRKTLAQRLVDVARRVAAKTADPNWFEIPRAGRSAAAPRSGNRTQGAAI
jgi:DNA-binding IclR family transcriptional regulator